jgi:hypothetical protein
MVNSPTFVGRARRSESRFQSDFAAQRGCGGRLGVSEAAEGFVTTLESISALACTLAAASMA